MRPHWRASNASPNRRGVIGRGRRRGRQGVRLGHGGLPQLRMKSAQHRTHSNTVGAGVPEAGDSLSAEQLCLTVRLRARPIGWTVAPGDKVMQTENDYDREAYNGDIGFITAIDTEDAEITVR